MPTLTFVQYDDNGEIFHIAHVESFDEETHRATASDLAARAQAQKVLVLAPSDPVPEHGRNFVQNGAIKRRTDAQFTAWQKAQGQPPAGPLA